MAVDWTKIDRNDPAARRRAALADIVAQQDRKPRVNASGYPLPWTDQPEAYRAVIDQATHERAHGTGHRLPRLVDGPRGNG